MAGSKVLDGGEVVGPDAPRQAAPDLRKRALQSERLFIDNLLVRIHVRPHPIFHHTSRQYIVTSFWYRQTNLFPDAPRSSTTLHVNTSSPHISTD